MPNHFLMVGLCGRDYRKLREAGLEDYEDVDLPSINDANLCELAWEMPKELEGIVSSDPRCRYRNKLTGEWSKDCNGPFMRDDSDDWEKIDLSDSEVAELRAVHGAADWYEWKNMNWGTKWGTYDTKVHEMGGDGSPILIECTTAWGPPTPQMMGKINKYLCDKYFLKNIKWIGHDPYDNNTCDIEVVKD